MRLGAIVEQVRDMLLTNEASGVLNSRGPGERGENKIDGNNRVTGMADIPANWRPYFESLSRADQRKFAATFGPRVLRTNVDLQVLNEALADDGRLAKLTRPYKADPIKRREMRFSNAYLQR
jgi:hypothetical protein